MRDAARASKLDWSKATTWDYETTGLQWWKDQAYALAVLIDGIPHIFLGDALAVAMTRMCQTIEDSDRSVIAYNAKFELHFSSRGMLNVRARIIDPSLALFLLDENKYSGSGRGLKYAVKQVFGYEMVDFSTMLGTVQYETGEYKTRKCKSCSGKGWRGRDHSQCESCAGVGTESRPVIRTRQRRIDEVDDDSLAAYAGDDVYWTEQLWNYAVSKLAQSPELSRYFHEISTPLLTTLYYGEHRGIRIDMEKVRSLHSHYLARIAEIDSEIKQRTGMAVQGSTALDDGADPEVPEALDLQLGNVQTVNLDSPAQVDGFLYGYLGLQRPKFKVKRKAKDGSRVESKWQTDENCLLWVWKNSATDIPKLIWERRKCAKYVGTYLNNMLREAVLENDHSRCVQEVHRCAFPKEEVWVLYPSFNMTIARTGRLSSSGVLNFQNIPHSKEFRELFIARPGKTFVIADAKQVELRFLAHFSNDPELTGPYSDETRDLHQETADKFGISRYVGKTANFAEVYEVYGNTFAMQLFRDTEGEVDITKQQAQQILDQIRAARVGVRRWKSSVVSYTRQNGFIKTVEGRRRRLPEIVSASWAVSKYAERQAINARIQGSVGDMFGRVLAPAWNHDFFLLQVHDECVYEADLDSVDKVAIMSKREIEGMTERYNTNVPLLADVSIGTDWSAK